MTLMLAFATSVMGQVIKVTGQVLAAGDNQPLMGASIIAQGGGKLGTVTDLDGNFVLAGVETGQKLEISFIGFETQVVTAKPEMKIYLNLSTQLLDETIVVAFSKQKRESFTGSASVVTASDIARQQVSNPIEALNGNVTGLQMLETNSFSSDPAITIRGLGSINASTSPLIVLDGLPYNGYWNDINPADVSSITVLKDAASNALYGARGANGVILITTKNAQRGKTKISFNSKWGINTNARIEYDMIKDPGQYYEAYYLGLKNYFMNSKGQGAGQAHISANNMLLTTYDQGGL